MKQHRSCTKEEFLKLFQNQYDANDAAELVEKSNPDGGLYLPSSAYTIAEKLTLEEIEELGRLVNKLPPPPSPENAWQRRTKARELLEKPIMKKCWNYTKEEFLKLFHSQD